MPLKKIALLTIVLIIPAFVYFIMCPVAHSFTASKCQQLLIGQQQFQKNNVQQKESASAPLGVLSFSPLTLQVHYKTVMHALQPSADLERSKNLTLLQTTRINV
jgi:hypothetical protein